MGIYPVLLSSCLGPMRLEVKSNRTSCLALREELLALSKVLPMQSADYVL